MQKPILTITVDDDGKYAVTNAWNNISSGHDLESVVEQVKDELAQHELSDEKPDDLNRQ